MVLVHTYIANPFGHVVHLTNLALIHGAFCLSVSMNGERKDSSQNGRLAKVVDVGQSLKWCVCSERGGLGLFFSLLKQDFQNAILPRYTHTHKHVQGDKNQL